jgi:ABC-type Mn2+/Zn2+ transport system ATPase subunit
VKAATTRPLARPDRVLACDEPLDGVEEAFVRAMVGALLAEIREEEAASGEQVAEPNLE